MIDEVIDVAEISRREIARDDYDTQTAEAVERLKHQLMLVDRGLQGLLFINGAALVALFTLIGSSARLHLVPTLVWGSFGAFAAGIVLALIANLGAFLSQGYYHGSAQFSAWEAQRVAQGVEPLYADRVGVLHARGRYAEIGGIITAVFSLLAFIAGCGLALAGVLPQT